MLLTRDASSCGVVTDVAGSVVFFFPSLLSQRHNFRDRDRSTANKARGCGFCQFFIVACHAHGRLAEVIAPAPSMAFGSLRFFRIQVVNIACERLARFLALLVVLIVCFPNLNNGVNLARVRGMSARLIVLGRKKLCSNGTFDRSGVSA